MGIALTLAEYLAERDITYELVEHPHTETALASAVVSKLPTDSVIKAVVLKGGDGFIVALVPASRQIHFDELRRLLGDNVDLAGEEQIETLFLDCEPGSVPALGDAYRLKVVIDDSLARRPDLYFEAGDHAHLVHIKGAIFRELTQYARHGHFSGTPKAA